LPRHSPPSPRTCEEPSRMSVLDLALVALIALNLVVAPYFLLLFLISLAAILARRPERLLELPRSRILIAIPAHDEAAGIAATVASCRAAEYPESLFTVVVIADNCSDRTSARAAEAGARVIERFDQARKSKGYAIEYMMDELIRAGEFDSLDALVIIDADTLIDPHLLAYFDQDLRRGCDWIQAYYTVANPDQTWRTRLLTY